MDFIEADVMRSNQCFARQFSVVVIVISCGYLHYQNSDSSLTPGCEQSHPHLPPHAAPIHPLHLHHYCQGCKSEWLRLGAPLCFSKFPLVIVGPNQVALNSYLY